MNIKTHEYELTYSLIKMKHIIGCICK